MTTARLAGEHIGLRWEQLCCVESNKNMWDCVESNYVTLRATRHMGLRWEQLGHT
jgi:hypothetical protein